MAFSHDGERKTMYNHYDSYPTGLGNDIVKWIISKEDFTKAKEQFKELIAVSDEVEPTDDQILALMRYYDPHVSRRTPKDWYSLLRETQGDPEKTLEAGYYEEAGDMYEEYSYVIDLDGEVLDVYLGGIEGAPVASYDFEFLRSNPDIMENLEEELD